MNIKTKLAYSSNYTKGRIKAVEYIVIHYTANNGDTALSNCNYFQGQNRNASAHYFVDENDIYNSVLENDTAWHCGTSGTYYHASCRNNNSIGIELCSRKDSNGNYYFKSETVENAIALTKYLMKKYNISAQNVVRHYDVTHKVCPAPFVKNETAWQNFKKSLSVDTVKTEEVREVKKTINVNLIGKDMSTEGYFADNKNLFTADFIRALGFEVGYDADTKQVTVTSKTLSLNIEGKNVNVENINIAGNNFCGIRSLANAIGNFDVGYKNGQVMISKK